MRKTKPFVSTRCCQHSVCMRQHPRLQLRLRAVGKNISFAQIPESKDFGPNNTSWTTARGRTLRCGTILLDKLFTTGLMGVSVWGTLVMCKATECRSRCEWATPTVKS